MGGNGMLHRWKLSFHRSSSSSTTTSHLSSPRSTATSNMPPQEFLCPITGSLMHDPVVVSSGHTFDRTAVQVCKELNFTPRLPDGSRPDFSSVIVNLALRTTIGNWCDKTGASRPIPPDYYFVESIVRGLMTSSVREEEDSRIRVSERELLRGVADHPPVLFSHAETELNPRRFYSSSSSVESVIANGSTPLPFATRPSCYSPSSSPSTSLSEINSDEAITSISAMSSEEENLVIKLKKLDVADQEEAVNSLRKSTRTDEESRVALCTPRILSALKPLLISRYTGVQTNATAVLVNLSLPKVNKVKLVRAGMVPPLVQALQGGSEESQEHAAGALFSLALEDENKTAIGVLGALQPLLHALRTGTERTRLDSAMALYNLTLAQSNRLKLLKLGAVPVLLGMLKPGELAGRVVLVVCNLAVCQEGKSALLDGHAVESLLDMLRTGSGLNSVSTRENCVAALHSLSQGSLRFKGLAREARAAEVLQDVVENGTERAREKAKRMLMMLKGRNEEGGEEVDWEGIMEGGVTRTRYRVGRHTNGLNSTEF